MKLISTVVLSSAILFSGSSTTADNGAASSSAAAIFGFRDAAAESVIETRFLAAPDAKLAEEHLRILTKAPHMAGTPEDKATAEYVAQKFPCTAGLETEIVEYKVWINYPSEITVDLIAPANEIEMHGPTREHVDNDPFQDDPRVVMPFNSMSPSGDASRPKSSMPTTVRPKILEKLDQAESRRARQDCARPLWPRTFAASGLWSRRSTARPE